MKIKLSVGIFSTLIFSSLIFSCSKNNDCRCNGAFKGINDVIITVPEVDCKTGEPGFTYPLGTGRKKAEYLGCQPN
ncbi:hypothetical protein GSB9_02249 [Flavobacteriaceae bacterium GSB9]|nr:hypothetical protein GSB9_02249 [Flavobacteriaceae bacterium GSB9]